MSYNVHYQNKYLWSPALKVGDHFLGTIKLLEKYLDLESGVTSLLSDEIEIDEKKLGEFLNAAKKIEHSMMLAMTTGTVEILQALKWKIDRIDLSSEEQRAKAEESTKKYIFIHEGTFRD